MVDTITTTFLVSVEKHRDRIAFIYFDHRKLTHIEQASSKLSNGVDGSWKTMTYGEFLSLSNSIASFIENLGLNRNDRIAIVSENRPEWCASYMAIVMCAGIAVPVDIQLSSEEIKNLLLDSETKIVFYSSKTETKVLKAIEGSSIKGINFDAPELRIHKSNHRLVHSVSPDDVASIIYTSGTTGKPKGVMLTHRNFCSDAEVVIRANIISHSDNVLSILPLHHTYPFMCSFLVPVFTGATVTFAPGLKSADIINAIKDNRVTVVVAVPRLLEMIRNGIISNIKQKGMISHIILWIIQACGIMRENLNINAGKIIFRSIHNNFPELRFFASGGARLEPSIMRDLEAMGFTILEGYGLTETSPVITFNPAKKRKTGSVGKPLPGVEIKINEHGEIMVKGPMVMKGYYKNQVATQEAIQNGWLLTGDTGFIDKEGYLFITGRKKEVIVLSSGKNIYPEYVEKLYSSIGLIKEICVIGMEREGTIDSLHAVIVPDTEYAKKSLIGNISEALKWQIANVSMRIPEYMRIKGFTLISEPLPRTPLGKLRRFMVRELIKSGHKELEARKEDKALMEDEVGRLIVKSIRSFLEKDIYIQSTDNLELDLGFDSLKRIELTSSLETIFSIRLPETFISEVQTVGDIVSRVKEYVREKRAEDFSALSWRDILSKEPLSEDLQKVGLVFSSIEMAIIYLLFAIQKCFFKIFYRLDVTGTEKIPDKGPYIIAPNHVSHLDGFVISASIPFKIFKNLYFLGFQKYFRGRTGEYFAKISHVIPVDPDTYLNRAMQISAYLLRNRKAMTIFPEGGRSFDGELMEFKKGIGVMSLELNIPVIPVYIRGTFKALPRGAKFLRPSKIEVVFGSPLTASDIDFTKKPEGMDDYQFFANELRERVKELSRPS